MYLPDCGHTIEYESLVKHLGQVDLVDVQGAEAAPSDALELHGAVGGSAEVQADRALEASKPKELFLRTCPICRTPLPVHLHARLRALLQANYKELRQMKIMSSGDPAVVRSILKGFFNPESREQSRAWADSTFYCCKAGSAIDLDPKFDPSKVWEGWSDRRARIAKLVNSLKDSVSTKFLNIFLVLI